MAILTYHLTLSVHYNHKNDTFIGYFYSYLHVSLILILIFPNNNLA